MGTLRQRIVALGDQAAPRGRILQMQLRISMELLITLAIAVSALASATAYQLLVHRRPGRRSSWL
jgi:hypothetical protein